jgi:hypothetical protein
LLDYSLLHLSRNKLPIRRGLRQQLSAIGYFSLLLPMPYRRFCVACSQSDSEAIAPVVIEQLFECHGLLLVGDAEVFHKHNRFAIAKNILHSLQKPLDTDFTLWPNTSHHNATQNGRSKCNQITCELSHSRKSSQPKHYAASGKTPLTSAAWPSGTMAVHLPPR